MKKKIYNSPVIKALSIGCTTPIATSTQTFNTNEDDNKSGVRDSRSFTGSLYDDEEDSGSGSAW